MEFALVYSNFCLTNVPSINRDLSDYNQEEFDTRVVLHAPNVSENNSFTELVIACSDTDFDFVKFL